MGILGVGNILVNFFEKFIANKQIQDWLRLVASLFFTIIIGFCGTAGPALASGVPVSRSVGIGLSTVALGVLALYLNSPATKSLTAVVPQSVVEQSIEHPDQEIISGKDAEKR